MADDAEELEAMQTHEKLRASLISVLDTLSELDRSDRMKVLRCVRTFFELPSSE